MIDAKPIVNSCPLCKDGVRIDKELGKEVVCSCQLNSNKVKVLREPKPVFRVTEAHKEIALENGLVPESRINDQYDKEFFRVRIDEMCAKQNCKVKDYELYTETLDEISAAISLGVLRNSYIIGAPNGFGKTTFVYSCIKKLIAMNRKVCDYISLFELAELRADREAWILNNKSRQEEEERKFTWKDYMKADVLFTYFTDIENKKIESKALKTIIDIRGPKELPTIVMIASSLKPYVNDVELKRYVWDDILAYNDKNVSCDRLIHKSCFKLYDISMKVMV